MHLLHATPKYVAIDTDQIESKIYIINAHNGGIGGWCIKKNCQAYDRPVTGTSQLLG